VAAIVYLLCAVTALVCCVLLWRGYRRTQVRLLFWSSLCFGGFALDNFLLFLDRIVLPSVELLLYRRSAGLVAVGLLLFGLIWKSK